MAKFISALVTFIVVIIITIVNYDNKTDFSLLVYTFKGVSGILLLYVGVLIGVGITLPLLASYSKKYAKKVFSKSIEMENKRLKKEEKRLKKEEKEQKKQKKVSPIITANNNPKE